MRNTVRILLIVSIMAVTLSISTTPQLAQARHRWPTPPPSGGLVAPKLLAPANGAFIEAHPTFSWTAVPGTARYHIQVNHQTYWDQQYNFINNGSLTSPSYFMLAHPEAYSPHLFWRVRAIDANGVAGPWSEVREFTITTPYVVHRH